MNIAHFVSLLGGLALFLYGMQMMSNGLENIAGNRMKRILEKLTSNRFLGVSVGAGITAIIQSSSATTVMVVGFVNTGIMTLRQAVWIIMGANIGTTITGQLISMDIDLIAPLVAFLGVVAIIFIKKMPRVRYIGEIMAGFGVLFIGMDMMGAAMKPLRESEFFISLMTNFSNPLLGILVGALFTAIIQSSSASIGILQTLAASGLIPFQSAVFVLFGQNIGTCITALIASIGTNRNAKRTTLIHLMFNLIGTAIFTTLFLIFPIIGDWIAGFTPDKVEAQVANMHTLFNISTTLLLLPFGALLAKLAEKILPEPQEASDTSWHLTSAKLGNSMLGYSAIHTDMLRQEIERMIGLAKENVNRCFNAIINADPALLKEAEEAEEEIDQLNRKLSRYISKTLMYNKSSDSVAATEEYFLITGNTERIGDHALNIGGYVRVIEKNNVDFSPEAINEIRKMQKVTLKAMDKILHMDTDITKWLSDIAALEQQMDDMTASYRESHLERMKHGECSEEGCILYSELLTDFERIGDHVLNIAQAFSRTSTAE